MPVLGIGTDSHAVTWLGEPAADVLIAEARDAGLPLGEGTEDRVTLTPGGLATRAAFEAFVEASGGIAGDVVGTLAEPCARWACEPAFGSPVQLVRLRGGGRATPDRLAAAEVIEVPVDSRPFEIPLLDEVGGRTETLHGSAALVISAQTFAGVLWANLMGLGPRLFQTLPGPAGTRPLRLALAAIRAGSTDPERLGAKLVSRGSDVHVHPSAVVEASVLMDGAVVDAGAIVRHSIIGPGARVEPQGLCLGSVLGPGAVLQRRGFVTYGMLDRDAVCGGTLQLGYVGPGAQLKVGALLLDQVLGGPVRVSVDGTLHDAPLGVLGAALGARSVVGARVTVAAGRVVPPDTTVVAGGDAILLRPDVDTSGRYRVRDGGLVPC